MIQYTYYIYILKNKIEIIIIIFLISGAAVVQEVPGREEGDPHEETESPAQL